MLPKDTNTAAGSRAHARDAWVAPKVTRLAASEAEIGPAIAGPDLERVS